MSRSGRAARSWAARLGDPVPTRGAFRKVGQFEAVAGAQDVADVHPRRSRRKGQADSRARGQVLQGVHRNIALVAQQGVAEGRDEHARAAHLRQRSVEDVPLGPDVHEFHGKAPDGGQQVSGLLRLGKGELACPRADPNSHWRCSWPH